MKKLCTAIVAASMLLTANSFAFAFGSSSTCVLPKFLKESDKIYVPESGNHFKIVEIDKKSCWIKIKRPRDEDAVWLNINSIIMIKPEK